MQVPSVRVAEDVHTKKRQEDEQSTSVEQPGRGQAVDGAVDPEGSTREREPQYMHMYDQEEITPKERAGR